MIIVAVAACMLAGTPGDLSSLMIPIPGGWDKEHVHGEGHWVIRSPRPGIGVVPTLVLVVPHGKDWPNTPEATARRLKSDPRFLDEGFVWVGETQTEKIKDGFVLRGSQKYASLEEKPESASVVVRKLSPGWVSCWAPSLKSSHRDQVMRICTTMR